MATAKSEPRVGELLAVIDRLAPLRLAAEWDNVGLIAGRLEWPAGRVLAAIDLTDEVAREALRTRADALLLYHPPIFKGIRTITAQAESPTTLLPELLAAKISLLAVHTALDAAAGGTNDVLLDAFEIASRRPLEPAEQQGQTLKLAVFVPHEAVGRVREALAGAGAGVIGAYDECSFETAGCGSFRGGAASNPTIGLRGRLERVDEARLEMVVSRRQLPEAVRALYAAHPYEEPAFDIYPLTELAQRGQAGMGRVGVLRVPRSGLRLVEKLGQSVDLSAATVVGDLRRTFTSVTTAAGSFGVRCFRDSESLVITGEFKHHEGLELLKRGVSAIHVGHDASERPALRDLARRISREARGIRLTMARSDVSVLRPLAGRGRDLKRNS